MDVRHRNGSREKFPMLSAFGEDEGLEDGLTDSRRTVLSEEVRIPEAPVSLAPPARMPRRISREFARELARELAPELMMEPRTDPHGAPWLAHEPVNRPGLPGARALLNGVGRALPVRIANEELGDALERLDRVALAGAPAWVLYAMAGVSACWATTHAVQELARGLGRRVKRLFQRREPGGPPSAA